MSRFFGRLRARRVPFIPQMELAECGAACLTSVLHAYGCCIPLVDARQACGVSRDGVNALAIVRAARSYGLNADGMKVSIDGLDGLHLPAILFWNNNHFVVLERVTKRGAWIVDPARGRRHVSLDALMASYSGVALTLEPTDEMVRRPRTSASTARYVDVMRTVRSSVFMLLGSAFALELLGVLFPAANQILVDHIVTGQRDTWLLPLVVTVAAAACARVALRWLRDRLMQRLQFALDVTLIPGFVHHLLHLPYLFFQQRTTGDLISRVDANRQLRDLSTKVVTAVLDSFLLLTYALLMLAYDPRLGGVVIVMSAARMAIVALMRQRARQLAASTLTLRGREQTSLLEACSAPEVVKACGAESEIAARHSARMIQRVNTSMRLRMVSSTVNQFGWLFDGASSAAVIWVGGQAVLHEQMTAGVFAGFLTLQGLLRRPLESVIDAFSQWSTAHGIMARLDDVLDTQPEPLAGRSLASFRGNVTLENVSFRYGPSSPWICQNINLRVREGEKVALVGLSGQGKTTVARLMLGMLKPTSGRVLFDDHDLVELDRRNVMQQVGAVLQEPFLFDGTIRDNLTLHAPDVSHDALEAACRAACVDDLIRDTEKGYDSPVGDGGSLLSGGQRQRVAIARALIRQPRLIVMDEATSALDRENERRVHEALRTLGSTQVIIAHRLETVRDADRILVFDGGRIVEQGRHDELVSKEGAYSALLSASGATQ